MSKRRGWFLSFVDADGEVQNAVSEMHPLVWLAQCEDQARERGQPRVDSTFSSVRLLFYREVSEGTWAEVAHKLPAVS